MADDMFTVSLKGLSETLDKMTVLPADLRFALTSATIMLSALLETRAKQQHLSGPTAEHSLSVGKNTPTHTGGALRASVHAVPVQQYPTAVRGGVAYGSTIPYAAIHEFGGVIHLPDIVPVRAQALHFFVGGQEIFTQFVRAHDVHMPERAPLRTALHEMEQQIADTYKTTVRNTLKATGIGVQ